MLLITMQSKTIVCNHTRLALGFKITQIVTPGTEHYYYYSRFHGLCDGSCLSHTARCTAPHRTDPLAEGANPSQTPGRPDSDSCRALPDEATLPVTQPTPALITYLTLPGFTTPRNPAHHLQTLPSPRLLFPRHQHFSPFPLLPFLGIVLLRLDKRTRYGHHATHSPPPGNRVA